MRSNVDLKKQTASAQSGGLYILRIATVLLAIVSWWATAQGMVDYVFQERWQANLASLAVQGILLGLNFYLPTFWNYLKSGLSKGIIAVLTAVVLFCSSWFSYVYIVGQVYEETWDTESQILVQSTYRSELYEANDYVEKYEKVLQDSLAEQIASLYVGAKGLGDNTIQITTDLNLNEDRTNYADNKEFSARTEIASAIQTMETIIEQGSLASVREQALETLQSLESQIDTRLASLEIQIQQVTESLNIASQAVQTAQRNLNNAPAGTDTTALQAAVNNAYNSYERLSADLVDRQSELSDFQTAQGIIQRYQQYLGVSTSNATNQISDTLREIQNELLKTNLDTAAIEEQAIFVFDLLQTSEGDTSQDLLTDMDAFIRDVRDYNSAKTVESALNKLINSLTEVNVSGEYDSGDSWKSMWADKLRELKATIGALPVYAGAEHELAAYDRAASMDELDEMLRLYISNHNAADQALIYLASPYRSLAMFSLMLAFFLDICAFITGFLVDAIDKHRAENEEPPEEVGSESDDAFITPATARRYLYLTGDLIKEDGRYYYRALDGGNEIDIELPEQDFPTGFCVEESGEICKLCPQALAFDKMADGPRDGIYQDCFLQYSDHILAIRHISEQDFCFLTTIGEDTPVYRIRKTECIYETVQDIPPQQWQMVILALNSTGTLVSAIFLS